jgi:hypothetical protein
MNNVFVIKPYKLWGSVWCFDDSVRGLHQEPFIGNTNKIIDMLVEGAGIKNAEKGFVLFFSDKPLPVTHITLTKLESSKTGSYYQLDGTKQVGWLCGSLFKFFITAPRNYMLLPNL